MILVDTSIWIEMFKTTSKLDLKVQDLFRFATCPPVIQEVLQGFRLPQEYKRFEQKFLNFPIIGKDVGLETYLHAAYIFRTGRKNGSTIRSSVDCLIAAIAIENSMPVYHCDRDFLQIKKFTQLETLEKL